MRALVIVAVACAALSAGPVFGQSTAFTYQGRLTDAGSPAGGLYDFRFRLFDAASGGTQVGSTLCTDNVAVTAGLFSVQLDFGQQFATPAQRYLEIEVRTDSGLNCASSSGFVLLSPRQQVTAAPVATHANSAFALDAADGSPTNAVFVDNAGRVGIGTTTPGKTLTINGDMEIGLGSGNYQHLRIGGGNSDGFLYGSFVHFADGIHLGYNYYADAAGVNHIPHPDGGTSRITMQYGAIVFATAPAFGGEPVNRVIVESGGNVRLGPSTQLYAPAGEENLRIVRGTCDAVGCGTINVTVGTGFTASVLGDGRYLVTFTTPFNGLPTVTASAKPFSCDYIASIGSVTNGSAEIRLKSDPCSSGACGGGFHFIAVGPR